jgi:hypothetical protein
MPVSFWLGPILQVIKNLGKIMQKSSLRNSVRNDFALPAQANWCDLVEIQRLASF